jgi:hypothetical protein
MVTYICKSCGYGVETHKVEGLNLHGAHAEIVPMSCKNPNCEFHNAQHAAFHPGWAVLDTSG